jgi:hypothetical protein
MRPWVLEQVLDHGYARPGSKPAATGRRWKGIRQMQTGALVLQWCDDCGGARAFEGPPCVDGHAECPDLACLDCGAAIVLATITDTYPAPLAVAAAHATGAAETAWTLPRSA